MLIGIGYGKMNQLRAAKFAAAKSLGYSLARYVSSKTMTWPNLTIGENTFIMEANVIQPFASTGTNTILWAGTISAITGGSAIIAFWRRTSSFRETRLDTRLGSVAAAA